MNTDISFLPEKKQEELKQLTAFIVKEIQPVLVILFGSYARNTWVNDKYYKDGVYYTYQSDYDVLVVTKNDLSKGTSGKWNQIEHRADQFSYSAPISLIQHGLGFLKKELRVGSYFFTDIIKEGILLHDTGVSDELKPGEVDPEEVKKRAKEDFEYWHSSANVFFSQFMHAFRDGHYVQSVFELHQTTERYYTALLLVFTGYKPKSHDLKRLRKSAILIDSDFREIFPQDTPVQQAHFELLRRAYIDARYNKNYVVTVEDLEYLMLQVSALKSLVERVCWKKLEMKAVVNTQHDKYE